MGKINFNAFSSKILHFSDQVKHFFAEIFWRASQAARKLKIISRSADRFVEDNAYNNWNYAGVLKQSYTTSDSNNRVLANSGPKNEYNPKNKDSPKKQRRPQK